jgi:hypothetical protein
LLASRLSYQPGNAFLGEPEILGSLAARLDQILPGAFIQISRNGFGQDFRHRTALRARRFFQLQLEVFGETGNGIGGRDTTIIFPFGKIAPD